METKGYFYLALSVFAFSTMEIASKYISDSFNPLQLNFLRFVIGGTVLLPFAINEMYKKHIQLSLKDIAALVLIGILAVPVSMSLFQYSIAYTKASTIAVIISSNAVFVAPFSYFFLGEKMNKQLLWGLFLGVIGMVIIAYPSKSMTPGDFLGIILGIGSSITFALFSVLGKKMSARLGGIVVNSIVFLSGSLFMMLFLIYRNIRLIYGINHFNIYFVLYLGLVVTAAAYILMFKGLSYLPANKGSLVFFIKPVLAGILAYLILDEVFSLRLTIGTLFILLGISIIVFFKKKTNLQSN